MAVRRERLMLVGFVLVAAACLVQGRADAQAPPAPPAASAPGAPPPAGAVAPGAQPSGEGAVTDPVVPAGRGEYVYLPEGRRDPFQTLLRDATGGEAGKKSDEINLPPLQRVTVAELTVIGIVWGGFGYTAMLRTPDGRGYTVQRGTRIGNNNGIVSAITEKAVIVEERFTDIFGKKQVREYAKPLHVKESQP